MSDGVFEFEKLEVYQVALQLRPIMKRIASQLPRGSGDLRSHATRAERSIRLNIAEGAGKHRPGGKTERFRTARGSANECAAALDEILQDRLADLPSTHQALDLCHRIIAMLSRLIIYWEREATSNRPCPRVPVA